jgi:aminoglycoside phosphotransferase (APT) family kinase protein
MADGLLGTLIGAGRNADVYDIGDGRVLRRYRDGREARWVALEARVMTHARAFGVPVPEVFEVSGSDIVMEYAAGPTMLDALARRPWTFRRQARSLARLHSLVHQVPVIPELPAPCGDEDGDRQVLLHMDLHPQNVILTGTGPVIIDWEGAARGPATYNAAMTWVIVGYSQVGGRRLRVALARALQGAFTRSFAHAAGPIDRAWRATAIRHRLNDRNLLPAERSRLERLPHG